MKLHTAWLGRIHYDRALELMMNLASRTTRDEGYLLLLEHEPVITMGREFDESTLLLPPDEYERRGIAPAQGGTGRQRDLSRSWSTSGLSRGVGGA